jgi:hypothetical protein
MAMITTSASHREHCAKHRGGNPAIASQYRVPNGRLGAVRSAEWFGAAKWPAFSFLGVLCRGFGELDAALLRTSEF